MSMALVLADILARRNAVDAALLFAQHLGAVFKDAGFFGGSLGADLLAPHAGVAAFAVDQVRMRACFDHLAVVQDEDLVGGGDG